MDEQMRMNRQMAGWKEEDTGCLGLPAPEAIFAFYPIWGGTWILTSLQKQYNTVLKQKEKIVWLRFIGQMKRLITKQTAQVFYTEGMPPQPAVAISGSTGLISHTSRMHVFEH